MSHQRHLLQCAPSTSGAGAVPKLSERSTTSRDAYSDPLTSKARACHCGDGATRESSGMLSADRWGRESPETESAVPAVESTTVARVSSGGATDSSKAVESTMP